MGMYYLFYFCFLPISIVLIVIIVLFQYFSDGNGISQFLLWGIIWISKSDFHRQRNKIPNSNLILHIIYINYIISTILFFFLFQLTSSLTLARTAQSINGILEATCSTHSICLSFNLPSSLSS